MSLIYLDDEAEFMIELWKCVVGYEGIYEVSNLGNVRSIPRKTYDRYLEGKNLRFREHTHGYLRVSLYKNKIKKDKYIHRLVAEAFLENKENLPMINHIDGNKKNNRLENLEWVDGFENMRHAWKNGLMENVSKNLTIKCGKSCSLININTREKINFETREKLSLFLGYNQHWLSKAVTSNTNYKKACLDKGYEIEIG